MSAAALSLLGAMHSIKRGVSAVKEAAADAVVTALQLYMDKKVEELLRVAQEEKRRWYRIGLIVGTSVFVSGIATGYVLAKYIG